MTLGYVRAHTISFALSKDRVTLGGGRKIYLMNCTYTRFYYKRYMIWLTMRYTRKKYDIKPIPASTLFDNIYQREGGEIRKRMIMNNTVL